MNVPLTTSGRPAASLGSQKFAAVEGVSWVGMVTKESSFEGVVNCVGIVTNESSCSASSVKVSHSWRSLLEGFKNNFFLFRENLEGFQFRVRSVSTSK